MSKMIQNMVDDVCLYNAKVDVIKKKFEGKPDQEAMKSEIENIPLRSVPLILNPDDPKYRALNRVPLENEKGTQAGYFGWLFAQNEMIY
jgi:hypothetical protein